MAEPVPTSFDKFHDLPAEVIAELPETRRTLHQEAVDLILQNAATGMPFVLVLRSYAVAQLFVTADTEPPQPLENLVLRGLQDAGIGVIQVQGGGERVGSVLYDATIRTEMGVHAPSLWLADEVWLENVAYLVHRAQCIVVLLSLSTPGVLRELDTIVAANRMDRTVILVTGEETGPVDRTVVILEGDGAPDTTNVMETPRLTAFPRVLWIGDVERPDVLDTFVFKDLVDRLKAIQSMALPNRRELIRAGTLDREWPVTWGGIRQGFERLAMKSRAEKRSHFAAKYFGTVATLAEIERDTVGVVEATSAQLPLLMIVGLQPMARAIAAQRLDDLEAPARERWNDDPDFVLAHARLVAECVRTCIPDDLDRGKALLATEWLRCQHPLNRRALSTLGTAFAWLLRATDDVEGVLKAGQQALDLARSVDAPCEMARALTVLGATCDDLREFPTAEAMLRKAVALIPEGQDHLDAWLVRVRLARVLEHTRRLDDARAMLIEAARIAEAGSWGTWAGDAEYQCTQLGGEQSGKPT